MGPRPRLMSMPSFAAMLALAHVLHVSRPDQLFTTSALIWLPSGVAIAGVHLLGWRALLLVAAITAAARGLQGYRFDFQLAGAIGSSAEACVGAWLLRRLRVDLDLARLRDVSGVFLAATVAPTASLLARSLTGNGWLAGLHEWQTWWRMNALGVLVIAPPLLTWRKARLQWTFTRVHLEGALLLLATIALVLGVAWFVEPGMPAVLLLTMVLPLALLAALRFGPRGAATVAALGAITIDWCARSGSGTFMTLPLDERHVVVQLLLVTLVGVPLVLGALIAERDLSTTLWVRSQGLGQALLRVLPDVSYRLDPQGSIRDAVAPDSAAKDAITGAVGSSIAQLFGPEVADRISPQLAAAWRGEPTVPVEFQSSRGGNHSDHELRFVRLPDGDILAVQREITGRKRAERALAFQARILEAIASEHRRIDVFHLVVSGFQDLLPDCRASILMRRGSRLSVACAPSLPAAYNDLIEGLQIGPMAGACGSAAHSNCTVICGDLRTDPRWSAYLGLVQRFGFGACWSVPVRAYDGSVLGTFAIYHDLPRVPSDEEIRLVERAATLVGLAIEEERRAELLASIQRNVSEGLFRSVPDEGFQFVNTALANLLGYHTTEEMLREWRRCPDARHVAGLEALAASTTPARNRELCLHRRDGSELWALVTTNLNFLEGEEELVCDGAVTDITAHKQLEAQLLQAQKMEAVGQLAGGVAHDFNNLLTGINGFAEALQAELPAGSPLRRDVDQILLAGRRATSLTAQLLAFGRRQPQAPEVLDLGEVVTRLAGMLQRLIGEHYDLRVTPAPTPVCARADRGQLEQVLMNLVLNARDAMAGGGRIDVALTSVAVAPDQTTTSPQPPTDLLPGDYAVLAVADHGVGMTPAVQARAFDPFFTTKEVGKGTGLGLSTVYGIAKQSGGTAAIESRIGLGTTVRIYLPLAFERGRSEPATEIPRPQPRRALVLVAEDDTLVRELAMRALQQAGHTVLTASDGEQALALLEQDPAIELLVTDVVMPRLGGHQLAHAARALRPGLPILFMSGYSDDSHGQELDCPVLQKPFTAAELDLQVLRTLTAAQGRERRDTAPST